MSTIIDKLAATIERAELGKGGIKELPFIYADSHMRNIILDNVEPPFAAATPIESGAAVDRFGNYHEQVTMLILFGDLMCQNTPDYDARENERIIDECKQRAFKWLASLVPTNELELVSVNGTDRAYMELDAVITGFFVSVTLREVQGYGKCQL